MGIGSRNTPFEACSFYSSVPFGVRLGRAVTLLGRTDIRPTDFVEDVRSLAHGGQLASAIVRYDENPGHGSLADQLPAFRMWGPFQAIKEISKDNVYLHADLFEDFFVPQLELRLLTDRSERRIRYSAHLEHWSITSRKDENGNYV